MIEPNGGGGTRHWSTFFGIALLAAMLTAVAMLRDRDGYVWAPGPWDRMSEGFRLQVQISPRLTLAGVTVDYRLGDGLTRDGRLFKGGLRASQPVDARIVGIAQNAAGAEIQRTRSIDATLRRYPGRGDDYSTRIGLWFEPPANPGLARRLVIDFAESDASVSR